MANNGAWEVIKRVLQGKPAFEVDKTAQKSPESDNHVAAAHADNLYIEQSGKKIYPVVRVTHCNMHMSGEHAQLWADIHNESPFEVELDSITLLGAKTELDYPLRPHSSREFKIWEGHVLHQDPQGVAELRYKIIDNTDYFMSPHEIIANRQSDGVVTISELRCSTNRITDV